MAETRRVYIVDDDEAVRDSLSILVSAAGYRVEVFASAKAFLEANGSAHEGCLLADIRMPDMDGLELQDELLRRKTGLPVVIMTGHADVPLAVRAMKAGAVDFLEKPFTRAQLLQSLERAAKSAGTLSHTSPECEDARAKIATLTPREREVFDLLVAGDQTKVIAGKLANSPRTVQVQRGKVMHKLGVTTIQDLVRLALAAKDG